MGRLEDKAPDFARARTGYDRRQDYLKQSVF
jgi:hypothetical protein